MTRVSDFQSPTSIAIANRLDLNGDGVLDAADYGSTKASKEQFEGAIFTAKLMDQGITPNFYLSDLTGKKVIVSGMGSKKQELLSAVQQLGGLKRSSLSGAIDYLFVGDTSKTTKDDKAFIMNALGKANITVLPVSILYGFAEANGISFSVNTDVVVDDDFMGAFIDNYVKDYLTERLDRASDGASAAEVADLQASYNLDLDNYGWYANVDGNWEQDIRYDYDDGSFLTDANGLPVPFDSLAFVVLDTYFTFNGIGVTKEFILDKRTGEVLDSSDWTD